MNENCEYDKTVTHKGVSKMKIEELFFREIKD